MLLLGNGARRGRIGGAHIKFTIIEFGKVWHRGRQAGRQTGVIACANVNTSSERRTRTIQGYDTVFIHPFMYFAMYMCIPSTITDACTHTY